MFKNLVLLVSFMLLFSVIQAEKVNTKNVRYKNGKKIDFESLLVEGENKTPDFAVVTGNLNQQDLGLLKLREDFVDYMADDAGEEIK